MSREEIFETVKKILVEHTQFNEPDKLSMDSKLREDLNVDSLDSFEIIYDIENELGISVPDEDAAGFITIGDIVDYLDKEKNSKKA